MSVISSVSERGMGPTKLFTWIGIVLFLLGLVLVLVAVAYIDNETWNAVVTHIGSVLIGAGIVEVVIYFYASERLIGHATEQILRAMKLPVTKFFEDRDALPSVSEELKDVHEVWVAWHSGTVAHTMDFFPQGRAGRVILTHPETKQLKEAEKIGRKSADALAQDIRQLTEALKPLKQQNVHLRWFDGPIQNSIIIANPKSDSAWMRLEVVVPKEIAKHRPSFRVEKARSKKLFETFYNSYVKLWDASQEPP